MLRSFVGWLLIASVSVVSAVAQEAPPVPSNAEIRKILAERIDKEKRGVGIVVGVIELAGRRIVAHGTFAKDDDRSVDGDTIFEIGSITKVFTALLLADMVERGEAAFDDSLSKDLPEGTKAPERGGQSITLEHLANHTSGLPRLPANMKLDDMSDPYANYTSEHLFEFLSQHELRRDIGAKYEYSNLGAGLLGELLSRRAGISYEALVKQRISTPLGMGRTAITLSPEMKAQLATGHGNDLEPVANWTFQAIAGRARYAPTSTTCSPSSPRISDTQARR
jgi:D-alanyl-D-alanine-carboxypeptidase/D-alanyl-D-alanine-endopeptidase